MKLFECQNCAQPLYFENTRCESCGLALGYLPASDVVTALRPSEDVWEALAAPGKRYRYCANAVHKVCNWLIFADLEEKYCAACRHNRTIPDLSQTTNLNNWRLIEIAKHRLFYTLLKLKLPLATKAEDPDGLAFDFLADGADVATTAPVLTGHAAGLITINLAEADDAERERRRHRMRELYRTLLGHFRHEIAHYCWDRLVANSPSLEKFRDLFGDERRDYSCCSSTRMAPRATGLSDSSRPMRARIRGKILRKPGHIFSIWSTRSKLQMPSVLSSSRSCPWA
jgi:hypothetical protein